MRIALCIEHLDPGGAESLVCQLARGFVSAGHEVRIFCLRHKGLLAEDPSLPKIEVFHKRGIDFRALWRLRRALRNFAPDIVHSHLWVANFWTRIALVGCTIPVLVCEHSADEWKSPLHRFFDRRLYRPQHLTAISTSVQRFYAQMLSVHVDDIAVIENRIDSSRFPPSTRRRGAQRPTQLISVCRLSPEKAPMRIIDIAQRLHQHPQTAEFHWCIAGEGPLRAELEAATQARGLQQHLTWLGNRRDIAQLLAHSDIFVLASDLEGLPMSVLEAQVSGLPVLVSDVGQCCDALVDGGGQLCPPCADAFAAVLQHWLSTPEHIAQMAEQARLQAPAQFGQQPMLDAYLKHYRQLID